MLVCDEVRREVDGKLTYQYRKLERAMRLVPADRRRHAVDIGAHVGLWSMHLVKLFGHVTAFEPNLSLWDLFLWNLDGCAKVTLHRVALGQASGTAELVVYQGHSGHSHVGAIGEPIKEIGQGHALERLQPVSIEPLDQFGLDEVDFIKIDVEGLERQVVLGAAETIRRCRPVIVVEQKGQDVALGYKRDGALALLQKMGMRSADCIGGDYFMVW